MARYVVMRTPKADRNPVTTPLQPLRVVDQTPAKSVDDATRRTSVDPQQGRAGAQRFGGLDAKAGAVTDEVVSAAVGQLSTALEGAQAALSGRGSAGRVRARLKSALAALDTLADRARPNLGALTGLAGQIAAEDGPNAALAAQVRDRLLEHEASRVLDELKTASPTDPAKIDALIAGAPEPAKVRGMLATFYPGAEALGHTQASLRAALDTDLADGDIGAQLDALMQKHGVSEADIEGFFGMMAEVRAGFEAGTEAPNLEAADRDMQRTNWIHTRVEVLKAAVAHDAVTPPPGAANDEAPPANGLLATLMGSLTSDAFKEATPHSLLWHNRPGAELVLPLLANRHLSESTLQATLPTAMKLAHEHQITPAMFMSGAMRGLLAGAGTEEAALEEIVAKVGDPLGAPHKDGEIVFSDAAQAALEAVGIPGWATMDPDSPHFAASQVVALADVLQYVAPDGIIKIAVDIRDPEQPAAFMRDPNIRTAVGSSVGFSFAKGMEAIQDEGLAAHGAAQAAAVGDTLEQKVYPEVERRLRAALGLSEDDALEVPYWNVDVPVDAPLSEGQRASADLVKGALRDTLAALGGVPLDPFGKEAK